MYCLYGCVWHNGVCNVYMIYGVCGMYNMSTMCVYVGCISMCEIALCGSVQHVCAKYVSCVLQARHIVLCVSCNMSVSISKQL